VSCKTGPASSLILTASSNGDTDIFTFTLQQIIAADRDVSTLAGNKVGRAGKSSRDDSNGSEDGDWRIHAAGSRKM